MGFDAESTKAAASGFRMRASGLFIATLVVGNPLRGRLEEPGPSLGRQAQGLDAGRGRTPNLFDRQVLGAGRFFLAASAARGRRTDGSVG